MYSFTNRINTIVYSMLVTLLVAAGINHVTVRWGHLVFLRDSPVELKQTDVTFQLKEIDSFAFDRYFNEEILSFNFQMKADLTTLMTWNTHTVFVSLVCEYETPTSSSNSITVWD